MKNLILLLSISLTLAFIVQPNVVHAQDHEIKIDNNQDKDSVYIMLSDNQPGKYRQGRGKWTNYLNWRNNLIDTIQAIAGGGFFTDSEAAANAEQDGNGFNFTMTDIGDFEMDCDNANIISGVAGGSVGLINIASQNVFIQANENDATMYYDDGSAAAHGRVMIDGDGVKLGSNGGNFFFDITVPYDLPDEDPYSSGVTDADLRIDNATGKVYRKPQPYHDDYVIIFSQAGTSNPTRILLDDFDSGSVTLARQALGIYTLTSTGAFPLNKVIAYGSISIGDAVGMKFNHVDANTYEVQVIADDGSLLDLDGTAYIKFEVYK